MYKLIIEKKAALEIESYAKTGNKATIKKIKNLLDELKTHPKTGTGQPEQL